MIVVSGAKLCRREVVYPARLNGGSSLTAVYYPIWVLGMMLVVKPLGVIVADGVDMLGAVLRTLPLHIVRADCYWEFDVVIVDPHAPL